METSSNEQGKAVDHGHVIGLGISLPTEVTTTATIGSIDVDMDLALREGRYICTRFVAMPTVENLSIGVTGEMLREVAVADLIERAARDANAEEVIRTSGRRIIAEEGGLNRRSLEVVTTAYRYGYAIGGSPTREVVELLGLSRSKASRWIAEAREEGFLNETTERVPGGVHLGVEAARDRLDSLQRELAEAEIIAEHYREEYEALERRVMDPARMLTSSFDVSGGAERALEQRRNQLDRQYARIAKLRMAVDEARDRISRAGEELDEGADL